MISDGAVDSLVEAPGVDCSFHLKIGREDIVLIEPKIRFLPLLGR
jgi:hypothetical protein